MEVEFLKKACCLAESLDTCVNVKYVLDNGGLKDSVDKFVGTLVRNDKEFKEKLRDLELKYRPLDKIEFRQQYDFGDKMPLDEFINDCKEGYFVDSDGSGYYGTEDKQTNLPIYPSSIMSGTYRTDFSHVYWFNK